MSSHTHKTGPGIYPTSSEVVAGMLGFRAGEETGESHGEIPAADLPVPNLPIAELESAKPANAGGGALPEAVEVLDKAAETRPRGLKKFFKAALPYLLVFLTAVIAYYFFFSGTAFDFSRIFRASPKVSSAPLTAKDTALMQLQKDPEIMKRYQAWISQYYFYVSDSAVLDPNADNSGNGLNNLQKFLLDLNPKVFDTLSLGMADSQTLARGINPLTGGQLTPNQKGLVDKYFDLETISNRLTVETLRRGGLVAGSSVNTREAARSGNVAAGAKNVSGGNPAGGYDNPVNPEVDSDDLNLNIPGRLEVPALGINVPLIFSTDPKNFEKDLQSGVVHYPGTALPGQIGTAYISGHSSNYFWAKGNYNQVFSKLGDLPDNSSFIITIVQKNGKDARFHYVVTYRKEFSPTDQEQFRNAGESVAALSTCWPVGSTKSRLVIFGKLTQVEK